MSLLVWKVGFRMAVSLKDPSRPNAAPLRREFYYAQRDDSGAIFVQALNTNDHPVGEKTTVDMDNFLSVYSPEPLYFYNRVKPALDGVAANLAKGERHLEDKQYAKAETDFHKVLAVDEDNLRAVFGLGIACLAMEKIADGLAIFDKLMALDLAFGPEHTHLFNLFGIQMRKCGLFQQAVAYYERALELNPGDENLHFNASRSHFEHEDLPGAARRLSAALELNPDFSEALQLQKALVKASGLSWTRLKLEGLRHQPGRDTVGLDLDGAPWMEE